ncbi:MAG TPA: CDGSH iron-sulfur domain-containing protein [Tepidisphaeraceae bacterium]|nr:CDGSH iron-sulfur domain-containing protein [Tepidisphaeraceae bacterium]
MARLIRHDATGPIQIQPHNESVWICACGLSQTMPHCDGSHKKTKSEEPGKLYLYNKTRQAMVRVITDT